MDLIVRTVVCLMISVLATAAPAQADSLDDCREGLARGQEHASAVDDAHDYCGSYKPPADLNEDEQEALLQEACAKIHQVCEPIDAAAGARACLQAQSETTGAEQRETAGAYKFLKRLYDLCNVQ